jgi:UDP-N-acetylglucosamine--N-acetylmuramyl-(pentapeptide) pyrophosphoryl-undecaprenol N-acetylglucosamine transferase
MSRSIGRDAPRTVALAASPGGHVDLLSALADAVAGLQRTWVIPDGSRRQALEAQGERVAPVRIFGSSPSRLLGNLRDCGRALRGGVPDLVVTSGAGVVVPYCLAARAAGARVIYMETMARVTSASKAGRVLSRIAETTLVQWPETLAVYPEAELCSPPLLTLDPDASAAAAPGERSGTFIALGTHWQPFHRLMAMVALAMSQGLLPRPVVAQVDRFRYPGDDVEQVARFSPDEIGALMRRSEVVICHGGAGIISTAIRAGRRPLVLARRAALGEHIDDHQHEIVDKLAELDLVCPVSDGITDAALARAREPITGLGRLPGAPMRERLASLVGG